MAAGAVRLAAALDIHRVCAVGYAKMASALTLQNTLVGQPFAANLDTLSVPSTELSVPTKLTRCSSLKAIEAVAKRCARLVRRASSS